MSHTIDVIDPGTAGTIAGLFHERARRTPQEPAYQRYSEKHQRFETITWKEMYDLASRWQAALKRDNLKQGDRVAVILRNCPEWVLFDLAALGLGLVTVPLFANDHPPNIRYILEKTGAKLVFLQDREQWLRIEEGGAPLPGIERIVTMDPDRWDPRGDSEIAGSGTPAASRGGSGTRISELADWLPESGKEYTIESPDPSGLATVVYTSGTTGMPKGVMLSHTNILENAFACLQYVPVYQQDLFLSFLPLSHTFERTVGYYIPMMAGACVAYVRSIDRLAEDLLKVRPTVLISVPRIYERIYAKTEKELKKKTFLSRALFRLTVHTGWQRFLHQRRRLGWKPLFLIWPLLKKIVADRLTGAFGSRLRLSISGGAPMAFSIARVFIGLGLNFLQGYGLTETSPVISVNTAMDNDPATVGRPLPGIEPLIAPEGELLVRGPSVMLGYWQDRDATEAAVDAKGFLHTGDLAQMDAGGRIRIIGRIKEILVLSNGEKIPPRDLELAITTNPLFEQAMIVGEGRPYPAALVVLNSSEWERLAAAEGLPPHHPDILSDKRVESLLLLEIARLTDHFPGYAQIRRVHASLNPWRMRDGLITNTLKLRREKLLERFKPEVDSLFEGH